MKYCFGIIIILTGCIVITQCVKPLSLSDEDVPDIPVVNCIFTPDSCWTVYLARTADAVTRQTKPFENVLVRIYAGQDLIENLIEKQPGVYIGQKKPQIGVAYTLKVQIPGFSEVISTNKIPNPTRLRSATALLKQSSEPHCDGACTAMTVVFDDPADQQNFYEIEVYRYVRRSGTLLLEYLLGYTESSGSGFGTSTDPVLLAEGDLEYVPTTVFFSDQLLNGNPEAKVEFDLSGFAQSGGPGLNMVVRLRSVSQEYYQFRKSWTRHNKRQWINNNSNSIPDFFFTPPLELGTNITNGLGIFAGFSSDTIRVTK